MSEKLVDAMTNMNEKETLEIVRTSLDGGEDPVLILSDCIRAMETVGRRFEAGEYFFSELIMAGGEKKEASWRGSWAATRSCPSPGG